MRCDRRRFVGHRAASAFAFAAIFSVANFGVASFGLALFGAAHAAAAPADAALGLDEHGQIENPALQARFEDITKQLRCLVCQNESIADSNVQLASDLRRQVREMLLAGQSDQAIFDFMTARYGEFVRFNTPLEAKTLWIWASPAILLALGGAVVLRITRARSRMPLDDEPTPGST
jgi:cytochrome c-type biogenesis protein CcmH